MNAVLPELSILSALHIRTTKSESGILMICFDKRNTQCGKKTQTVKTYYFKKIADGCQRYNALGHCTSKLVRILYKILTENTSFQLS